VYIVTIILSYNFGRKNCYVGRRASRTINFIKNGILSLPNGRSRIDLGNAYHIVLEENIIERQNISSQVVS
jgi:hypothetical protein